MGRLVARLHRALGTRRTLSHGLMDPDPQFALDVGYDSEENVMTETENRACRRWCNVARDRSVLVAPGPCGVGFDLKYAGSLACELRVYRREVRRRSVDFTPPRGGVPTCPTDEQLLDALAYAQMSYYGLRENHPDMGGYKRIAYDLQSRTVHCRGARWVPPRSSPLQVLHSVIDWSDAHFRLGTSVSDAHSYGAHFRDLAKLYIELACLRDAATDAATD